MGLIKRIIKAVIPVPIRKYLKPMVVYTAEKPYQICIADTLSLDDKNVVVTGGSGSIGRAICFRLAAEGANVYVSGRTEETIMKVVDEIRNLGLKAEPFVLDVNDENSVETMFDTTFNDSNRLDILVNCAGGGARGQMKSLDKQSVEVIDSVLNSNLRGAMLCTRKAAQSMMPNKKGRIVIISSAVGMQGKANYSEYAAAKSGMFGFMKSMALELGKYGITVNCVSPGFIQRGDYNEEQAEWLKNTNCMHTIGTLEDVANAVYFMVSDGANFITGQNLCVDGGRTLGLYGDV